MNTTCNKDDACFVPCKNCKHYCWFDAFGECSHPCMCSDDREAHLAMDPDDFCSRGERKQQEE